MIRKLNRFKQVMGVFALIVLASCSTEKVKASKDPAANLSRYKSYSWDPALPKASALLDQTVREVADQELPSKGLYKVGDGSGDLLLSYSAMTSDKEGFGVGPGYRGFGAMEKPYEFREGSLRLQLIDSGTQRTVWEGTATDALKDRDGLKKQIATAVRDILKKYPST